MFRNPTSKENSMFLHISQGFGAGPEMPDLCTGKFRLAPGKI